MDSKSYMFSSQRWNIFNRFENSWAGMVIIHVNNTAENSIFQVTNKTFRVNVPFLYPHKTSGKVWFSDVFRACRNETLA